MCWHETFLVARILLVNIFKSRSLAVGLSFYISQLHAYEILYSMHCLTD
ncbi:hypothetical protein SLEP1_g23914 [Rubroshorea leprosula]|uniref:Uncharacterized protein n=1 Tax=Rubroshorea leprosula TaxID=152421 RepID=A0AAV5JDX4_9ROSI|nr:hypothetical protein SLEP1_g23914 [Rubroshorea leprosula]